MEKYQDREKIIIATSVKGIIVNFFLAGFKAIIGMMTNSIAITLDAVNNLSDMLSQIITIVGTKLSQRRPDKKHPYGYGRIEYISSAIVASIILFAGFTSFKESLIKVIHPEPAEYTIPVIIIVGVGVLIKFFFGRYVKAVGEKIDSQALVAAGTDGFMDAVLSFATFVAAIINIVLHFSLEGILGVVLSLFILKAGYEILMETVGSLIGERADTDFTVELKKEIRQDNPEVNGVFDLVLHDYGPSRSLGSVHVEVKADMSAQEIHHLSQKIIADVKEKHDILLTVGIYATDYNDPEVQVLRKAIGEAIKKHEHIMGFHAVNLDQKRQVIGFDILVSYKEMDPNAVREAVIRELSEKYPSYAFHINIDNDFSD